MRRSLKYKIESLSNLILLFLLLTISACQPSNEINSVSINIKVDGENLQTTSEVGSTIQSVIDDNGIILNALDRVSPPLFSVITQNETIEITRVREDYETEEIVIPFEQQTVRNETLPESQTILIQPGINGQREITYRLLYEDGILSSKTEVNRVETIVSRPEIMMVGVQTPFSSVAIDGIIAYITAGNAWIMQGDTTNRKPIVTNGKLDGRILSLSYDGNWLLYTQSNENEGIINDLWIINIDDPESTPINLGIENIIHYAQWIPGTSTQIAYSTVEPRSVAPGWQANNDLQIATLGADGNVIKNVEVIESNSGGIYGWWGSIYQFSPDGEVLSYVRPDSIGIVNFDRKTLEPLVSITPFQTNSEWAWISPTSWSQDGDYIYFVSHQSGVANSNDEKSPFFDLQAIRVSTREILNGIKNVGMFAFPVPSPRSIDNDQKIAFLKAIFPENSDQSRYRINISDRDGSNIQRVFPDEDLPGIDPQNIFWSPCDNLSLKECQLGFIYQGNIWLFSFQTNKSSQITGDGLISKIDWK